MIVRCRTNSGADLGIFLRGLFYGPDTRWHQVRAGEEYRVYGMALFQEAWSGTGMRPTPGLTVMLGHRFDVPPTVRPDWYPIELFDIKDHRLPSHWEFSPTRERPGEPVTVLARWGYPELVRSDEHFEGLNDRDPAALAIFRSEFERQEPTEN